MFEYRLWDIVLLLYAEDVALADDIVALNRSFHPRTPVTIIGAEIEWRKCGSV